MSVKRLEREKYQRAVESGWRAVDGLANQLGRMKATSRHLVAHLETCDMCQRQGLSSCSDVGNLIAILRVDIERRAV